MNQPNGNWTKLTILLESVKSTAEVILIIVLNHYYSESTSIMNLITVISILWAQQYGFSASPPSAPPSPLKSSDGDDLPPPQSAQAPSSPWRDCTGAANHSLNLEHPKELSMLTPSFSSVSAPRESKVSNAATLPHWSASWRELWPSCSQARS